MWNLPRNINKKFFFLTYKFYVGKATFANISFPSIEPSVSPKFRKLGYRSSGGNLEKVQSSFNSFLVKRIWLQITQFQLKVCSLLTFSTEIVWGWVKTEISFDFFKVAKSIFELFCNCVNVFYVNFIWNFLKILQFFKMRFTSWKKWKIIFF